MARMRGIPNVVGGFSKFLENHHEMVGNRSKASADRIYQRDAAKRRVDRNAEMEARAQAAHKASSHHDANAHKVTAAHQATGTAGTSRSAAAHKAWLTRRAKGKGK